MTEKTPTGASANEETTLLVVEETKSFVEFDQWMDAEIEKLVARWIHTAAPNANRIALTSNRMGKLSR